MQSQILLRLKEISIEVIIISVLVFLATMLIKLPIKKATSKLNENKRKATNTVIVFIPMLLSFLFSILYYGLFQNEWFSVMVYDTMASAYVLSIAIYAIFSRIKILIKGSKTQIENNSDYSKETVQFIKKNIKLISKALKIEEKDLTSTVNKIEKLLTIKNEINSNIYFQDISQVEKLDMQIKDLESKKTNITKSIEENKEQLNSYIKSLS